MWLPTGVAFLVLMVLAASGCGGGSMSPPKVSTPPVSPSSIAIQIAPNPATVLRGATQRFSATVTGTSNTAVIWSVQENQQGFHAGTIDSTGLYTAPLDAEGTFHVVATSHADPAATGIAAVNVPVPIVAISPAAVTLAPGATLSFTPTVTGLTSTDVTWTVQEPIGGAVNNMGFYSAPLTTGFYHVIAASVSDATVSGSATITVTTSSGRFTPTGNMQNGHGHHTATLLPNGKVLVAGSATQAHPFCGLEGVASAELYDPAAGSFSTTASMTSRRYAHTATLLLTGEVLVTGGFGSTVDCEDLVLPAQRGAELYNPSNGSFMATGHMVEGRGGHTATLLPNGKVLVTGGGDQGGGSSTFGAASKTAELYDPNTKVFIPTGNMATPRSGHTATLLANGKVLVVGGVETTVPTLTTTATAEIYDPATGTFAPTRNNMAAARDWHTATRLADGRVLIAGGSGLSTAEIYDPSSGFFSPTGDMEQARAGHTATLLPNGNVLVAGGSDSTAELYDPSTGSFSTTGDMETARSGHSATLLQNGTVLVAGGGSRSPLATAELYK